MKISSQFDGGSIEIIALEDFQRIRLNLRNDSHAPIKQWFYFRLQGAAYQPCVIYIENAAEATYPSGWNDYQAMASYDRVNWFRVPTRYEHGQLILEHTPLSDSIYYAYFEPYSWEQHLNLLGEVQGSGLCHISDLGSSVEGRDLNLLTIGHEVSSDAKIWLIARQHPAETMGEWFLEGFLRRILDWQDPLSRHLLDHATFYVVPHMNPDGAVRGNLRTNAAGENLNRAWQNANPNTSPEVFFVREKMQEIGVDLFLDLHGDESIPYVFVAGTEGNPNYSDKIAALETQFKTHFQLANPDFQTEFGYPRDAAGNGNLNMACNWVGQRFNCLSFTLEMPFKDNDNFPDDDFGWNGQRSLRLGESILHPIAAVLDHLRR